MVVKKVLGQKIDLGDESSKNPSGDWLIKPNAFVDTNDSRPADCTAGALLTFHKLLVKMAVIRII